MTRQRYICRMMAALWGEGAAVNPEQYHFVAAMAERAARVCPFDEDGACPSEKNLRTDF